MSNLKGILAARYANDNNGGAIDKGVYRAHIDEMISWDYMDWFLDPVLVNMLI